MFQGDLALSSAELLKHAVVNSFLLVSIGGFTHELNQMAQMCASLAVALKLEGHNLTNTHPITFEQNQLLPLRDGQAGPWLMVR